MRKNDTCSSLAVLLLMPVTVLGLWTAVPCTASRQQTPGSSYRRPLTQKIASLTLSQETIFDGIAKLNQITDLPYSIELALKPTRQSPDISNPTFTAEIQGKTLREALDWLCTLDPRYAWSSDGTTINIFPRSTLGNHQYFMNKRLPSLHLDNARNAEGPVFQALRELPGKQEQLAIFFGGMNTDLPKPWTQDFRDISIRELLNRSAQQLCHTCGWELFGSQEFRLVAFHSRLRPKEKGHPKESP